MIALIIYLYQYFRLILKAGIVWGCWSPDQAEMHRQILATPLKYELLRLQKMRESFKGKDGTDSL